MRPDPQTRNQYMTGSHSFEGEDPGVKEWPWACTDLGLMLPIDCGQRTEYS